MHPVDEYAALKAEISRLETRAKGLRAAFLSGSEPLQSNAREIIVRTQARKVLRRDRLPPALLEDPELWETRRASTLRIVERIGEDAEEDDLVIDDW